jgi:hypothetical protein
MAAKIHPVHISQHSGPTVRYAMGDFNRLRSDEQRDGG